MKPEIRAMLPELPISKGNRYFPDGTPVYSAKQIEAWLDKLTEGAEVVSALSEDGVWENRSCSDDTHTALLICPREIKKQTPLEILETELKRMHDCVKMSLLEATAWMGIPDHKRDNFIKSYMDNADFILEDALARVEAAT